VWGRENFVRALRRFSTCFVSLFLAAVMSLVVHIPLLSNLFKYLQKKMSSTPFQPDFPESMFCYFSSTSTIFSFWSVLFLGLMLLGVVVSFKKKKEFYSLILFFPFVLWGISSLQHHLIVPRFCVWILPYYLFILSIGIDFLCLKAKYISQGFKRNTLRIGCVLVAGLLAFSFLTHLKRNVFYKPEMVIAEKLKTLLQENDVILINDSHFHLRRYVQYNLGKKIKPALSKRELDKVFRQNREMLVLFKDIKTIKRRTRDEKIGVLARNLKRRNTNVAEYLSYLEYLYSYLEKNALIKMRLAGQYTLYRVRSPLYPKLESP
jgi:hypothetical protein